MKKLKKPFLFALALLPVSVIAIIFTCLYQFDLYPAEVIDEMLAVFGSRAVVIALTVVQNAGLIFVLSFFGYILAGKQFLTNLRRRNSNRRAGNPTNFCAKLFFKPFGNGI